VVERDLRERYDEFDDFDDEPEGLLRTAAPWLALLALVIAAAVLGYVLFLRPSSGDDLAACRSAAWTAIPDQAKLPQTWQLGSTDLNANGMTISIVAPASADESADQPVVYASITCYGPTAKDAMDQYREAASKADGATVTPRGGADAFDVTSTSGSVTTLFRVGDLVGQIADGGTAEAADRNKITAAVAAAMGDPSAAGTAAAEPSDDGLGLDPGASEPVGSGEPSESPFAPELEALLPSSIDDPAASASPGASAGPIALSKLSASATDVFGSDPSARALAARIRSLGSTMDKLQIAQAYDESGTVDLSIIAFRLPGAAVGKLEDAIVETWLSADATGVTKTPVTLGGKRLIKVDYGDGSTIEYAYAKADYVIVIDTSDADVAAAVAAKLP
jgi:hypothetical protein